MKIMVIFSNIAKSAVFIVSTPHGFTTKSASRLITNRLAFVLLLFLVTFVHFAGHLRAIPEVSIASGKRAI